MKKHLLTLFVFILSFSAAWATDKPKANILLINSYHPGYIWSDNIISGLKNSFNNNDKYDLLLDIEYMDSKRFFSKDYFDQLKKLYQIKFKNKKYDAIVVSDENAFHFILKNGKKMFADTPVVFCGVNKFKLDYIKEYPNMTGIAETYDIEKTVRLALNIHPLAKEIFVVHDMTTSGISAMEETKEILDEMSLDKKITYAGDVSAAELELSLSKLDPKNSIVLMLFYARDNEGIYFTENEAINLVSNVYKGPIYGFLDLYLGDKGVIGGVIETAENQGRDAASMIFEILDGKSVRNIPVVRNLDKSFVFDAERLEHFEIPKNFLPKNSIYINEKVSSFQKYKSLIFSIVSVLIFILYASVVLLINLKKQQETEKKLLSHNEEMKKKVDYDDEKIAELEEIKNKLFEENINLNKSLEAIGNNFNNIISISSEFWFRVDENLKITSINEKLASFLGYSARELQNADVRQLFDEENKKIIDDRRAIQEYQLRRNYNLSILHKNGTNIRVRFKAVSLKDADNVNLGAFAFVTPIKDQEKHIDDEKEQIMLPNEGTFTRALITELTSCKKAGFGIALLLIKIDDFDNLSKLYSNVIVDNLVSSLSYLIMDKKRPSDLAGKFEDDVFAMLLTSAGEKNALDKAHQIIDAVKTVYVRNEENNVLHYSVSIGLMFSADCSETAEEIITKSKAALSKAALKKDCIVSYKQED